MTQHKLVKIRLCYQLLFQDSYPGAVDPTRLINSNVSSQVLRGKALHKNELFEQRTVTCKVLNALWSLCLNI